MKKRTRANRTILESCTDPTLREIHRAALAYRNAGLSFIPIKTDGSKQPAFHLLPKTWCKSRKRGVATWKTFTQRQPTREEIDRWFRYKSQYAPEYGLAVVAGQVSGSLEIIDFDTVDLVDPFVRELAQRAPGLFEKLVKVKSPRPGMHLYYRCPEIGGNQKLARIQDPESTIPKPKPIIEVKGEGGYCLAPPSPDGCHPRQTCYLFGGDKDLTEVPTITPEERQALFAAVRTLDRWKKARPTPRPRPNTPPHRNGGELRPGDDFNQRAEWADILQGHGWTYAGPGGGGSERWTRPGKVEGCSATTNYGDTDRLYVFSANTEHFDPGESYSKFEAFALLNYEGDFNDAARVLRRKGYGKSAPRTRQRTARRPSRSPGTPRRFR